MFHVFELFNLKLVCIRFGKVEEYNLSFPVNMTTLLNSKWYIFLFFRIVCFSKAHLNFEKRSMDPENQTSP